MADIQPIAPQPSATPNIGKVFKQVNPGGQTDFFQQLSPGGTYTKIDPKNNPFGNVQALESNIPNLPTGANIAATSNQVPTTAIGGGSPVLNVSSSNPALSSIIDSANSILKSYQDQGGVLTPEIINSINAINQSNNTKSSAVANARTAANNKDTTGLNNGISAADQSQNDQQTQLQNLLNQLTEAQGNYLTSLSPSQNELDLQKQIADLKSGAQLLPLELRSQGISAKGIAAGLVNDNRVRAIQEQNLLTQLGLEQDARKMKSQGLKDQVGFIQNNIDLQQKIQDRLTQNEQNVVDQAQKLSVNSLNVLQNIVKQFTGLDWQDMDAQTQQQILNLIKPYPDLNASLVSDALKNAKQQQILDRAKKGTSGTSVSTLDAIQSMNGEIQGLLQSTKPDGTPYSTDGYISPEDWKTALDEWNAKGFTTSSFISNFKRYANPNDTYIGIKNG